MDDPHSRLVLPIIVLAEACWVVERGRCATPTVRDLLPDVDADPRLELVPLDRAIVELSTPLTTIAEMHDRQITATALRLANDGADVALLTRDPNLTASRLVPIVW